MKGCDLRVTQFLINVSRSYLVFNGSGTVIVPGKRQHEHVKQVISMYLGLLSVCLLDKILPVNEW